MSSHVACEFAAAVATTGNAFGDGLPAAPRAVLSGTVNFRVIDTDRAGGHTDLGTIHIGDLFVRSVP